MNKELLQQLKDAGFPQMKKPHCGGCECFLKNADISLDELIEACGKDFGAVLLTEGHPNGNWFCLNQYEKKLLAESIHSRHYHIGKTPEEAVAKLWLELKKL